MSPTYERVYAVVRRIPRGRVATYGQVARLARLANGARQVGYALHALPEHTSVPWHRVVNARGAISLRGGGDVTQRILLEREGVRFGAGGRIDLAVHGWRPRKSHIVKENRMLRGIVWSVVLSVALAGAASAQGLTAPPTWRWVTDAPARHVTTPDVPDSAFRFVSMPPGWHVTMGPGGLLFDPRHLAEGRFTLESEIFLFPGQSDAEYGLFVGGRDLEAAEATYAAFVVRRDGSFAVLRRRAGTTSALVPWTRHDSIPQQSGEDPVKNVLRVDTDSVVTFRANGALLATIPRDSVPLAGAFGFRVGPRINLHASRLDVTQRLAPVPRARRTP